ncbi:MAG: hypothetical protein ACRD1D_03715 [Acidimicrobiales bacterium]
MARISPIKLDVKVKGDEATVNVRYDILWSQTDLKNKQAYEEECRLIGDDTHAKDPATAGGDDTLEFLTPLFNKPVKPGKNETTSRRVKKTFRAADLNEDVGSIPDPDEIRARVTLRKVDSTVRPSQRESPMVKLRMG